MPELPEVESIRRGLLGHVVGRQITGAQAFGERVSRRSARPISSLVGGRVAGIARRGKFLWFDVAGPDGDRGGGDGARGIGAGVGRSGAAPRGSRDTGTGIHVPLVAHLGMSGQFRLNCEGLAHVRASITLSDGNRLDFIDQRTFGYLATDVYVPTADGAPGGVGTVDPVIPHLVAHIGRDLLDPYLDKVALAVTIVSKKAAIKTVLLNQEVVSGIGNIYADEALFDARIHPLRPASSLTGPEVSRLLTAVTAVLERSLAAGGTSFDALYVNVNGESGYFERSLKAYGRTGAPCPRCGEPIQQIMVGGRSSHFCPRCQQARG